MDIPEDVFAEVLAEACRIHSIPKLKDMQHLCLRKMVEGRDMLACLPTGYGRVS